MKGHQDTNDSFLTGSKVLESLAGLSSQPPLEPPILVLRWPIHVLLQPVETTKDEFYERDVVADQVLTRRGSEGHP